ncbi:hypothetical protein D9M72_605600 [compost metagenome]
MFELFTPKVYVPGAVEAVIRVNVSKGVYALMVITPPVIVAVELDALHKTLSFLP